MIHYPPKGLLIDLVTPMTEPGVPDGEALTRLVRRLKPEAAGFVAGSLFTGETLAMSGRNRLTILETAAENTGPLNLLFEVTGISTAETETLLTGAEKVLEKTAPSIRVFYLLTPLVFHGNRELPELLMSFGRLTRRGIVLSNNPELVKAVRPGPHHKNIRTSVFKKLAANEQLAGMIFHGDLERAVNYQRVARHRPGFRFYDGDEAGFIERPSSSGLASQGANLMPQAWADIVSSSLNMYDAQRMFPDHLNQIWASGKAVRILMDICRPNPPAFLKAGLAMSGVIPGPTVSESRTPLTSDQTAELKKRLKELHLI